MVQRDVSAAQDEAALRAELEALRKRRRGNRWRVFVPGLLAVGVVGWPGFSGVWPFVVAALLGVVGLGFAWRAGRERAARNALRARILQVRRARRRLEASSGGSAVGGVDGGTDGA